MSGVGAMPWSAAVVPMRRRTDLVLRPSFAAPTKAWLVKDPVALRYYEMPEEEHFVWQLLDGRTTWNELRSRYEAAFAPRQIDGSGLVRLLEELYRRGLIVSDRPGQGGVLQNRGDRERRNERLRRFANPLAIRLPGIDPQPWLPTFQGSVSPLLAKAIAVGYFALCALAVVSFLVHFDVARRELAATTQFPAVADWPSWILAIVATKVIHELAHAAACRRYGGECREIGLLLLCGMPCLYCDVTSMWMTPERWKRIAVSAAGMIAEFALAAVAILLWRFSEPGLVHSFCLRLAIVCSVGTLLINANPLLRYDGYFMLADLVDVANLGERADAALRETVRGWFFGEGSEDDARQTSRYRRSLALFALASAAYRWTLTIFVLWFVRRILAPHGLTLVSDVLTLVVVGSLLVPPLRQFAGRLRVERDRPGGGLRRFAWRGAAAACFLAAILLWPWPYRVAGPAVAALHDAEYLYVVTGGRLTEASTLGAVVSKGDRVAVLTDPRLDLEVVKLEADVARRRLEIDNLERRRVADPSQGAALPAARDLLKTSAEQLAHLRREQARLQIVASRAGTVVPLYNPHDERNPADDPAVRTSPLEPSRRGAYLPPGTPLCAVGDPTSLEAQATIDQDEIEFVRRGQTVQLRFDAAPERTFVARIVETSEAKIDEPSATRNGEQPGKVRYLARIALDGPVEGLRVGAVGRAKIEADPQSLWTRLRRTLDATFRFVWNAP